VRHWVICWGVCAQAVAANSTATIKVTLEISFGIVILLSK
jgi:hypothetical protein